MNDNQSLPLALENLEGGLTTLDIGVIGIYFAGLLLMGVVIARKQRCTEDFFVGGRNLPA